MGVHADRGRAAAVLDLQTGGGEVFAEILDRAPDLPPVLRAEFLDIGAVVHFLRRVVWTVPGFSFDRYRDKLRELHERIQADGPMVSYARRYFIEARR